VTSPANPTPDPGPDPATNPAVDSHGGQPGETPPDAGQMSGAAGDAHKAPNMGPVSGNRTPMIIALVVLAFFVLATAIITGASFFPSD
jgi:hypothetical protein